VHDVGHDDRRGQRDEDVRAEPPVERDHRRRRGDHQDVDRQEPQRQRHLAATHAGHARGERHRHREHRKHGPEGHEPQGRAEQPRAPGAEPVPVGVTTPHRGLPRDRVRVAAHEEEDRHHLEEPGCDLEAWLELQQVLADEGAVAEAEDRQQPVAEHDERDREEPQQVDVAVARGRGRRRQLAGSRRSALRPGDHVVPSGAADGRAEGDAIPGGGVVPSSPVAPSLAARVQVRFPLHELDPLHRRAAASTGPPSSPVHPQLVTAAAVAGRDPSTAVTVGLHQRSHELDDPDQVRAPPTAARAVSTTSRRRSRWPTPGHPSASRTARTSKA